MFKNLVHKILLTCQQSTLLMEKERYSKLSTTELWRLQGHLKVCKWCASYAQKSEVIDKAIHQIASKNSSSPEDVDLKRIEAGVLKEIKKD